MSDFWYHIIPIHHVWCHEFACRFCQTPWSRNVIFLSHTVHHDFLPVYDVSRILGVLCHEDDLMVSRACGHAGLWHVNGMPRPCLSACSPSFNPLRAESYFYRKYDEYENMIIYWHRNPLSSAYHWWTRTLFSYNGNNMGADVLSTSGRQPS